MTSVYSNYSFRSMQSGILTLKLRLEKLQGEVSSGRRTTPAIMLGAQSGPLFLLRQDATALQAYRDNIVTAKVALQSADLAFSKLSVSTEETKELLLQYTTGTMDRAQLGRAARRILEAFADTFASTGSALNPLAGQSANATPLIPYYSIPASGAQTDYQSAFLATFGFAINDPLMENLSESEITSFTEGVRADYENQQSWENLWLSGPVVSLDVPVSSTWKSSSPTVASADDIKHVAAVLVNLAELADTRLNEKAFKAVISGSFDTIGVAEQEITATRVSVGLQLSKLSQFDQHYQIKQANIDVALSGLEDIDQYAAITEMNALKSQLDISYTITSRIQNLFLAQYIS